MATAVAKRLVPLLDRVLVEKVVPPTKSAGGILLPDSMTKVGLFSFFLLSVCLSVSLPFLFPGFWLIGKLKVGF
jgi:hypothetical protein